MLAPPGRPGAGRVPQAPALTKEPDPRGHRSPAARGQLCQPAKHSPLRQYLTAMCFQRSSSVVMAGCAPATVAMWFSPRSVPMNSRKVHRHEVVNLSDGSRGFSRL